MTMAEEIEVEVVEEDADAIVNVPITKAKGTIKVDASKTPIHMHREAIRLGYKALLNRGMTKLTKESFPEPDKLREAAMEQANKNLEALYAGKLRVAGGAKSDKVPREVMTEARRIARSLIKDELKRSGVKISLVESSEITKAANALLAANPTIVEQAEEEVQKRAASKIKVDVGTIAISAKKLKAAEAKKAEKVLSQAKAGKIASRPQPRA